MYDDQTMQILESTGLSVDMHNGVISDGLFVYGTLDGTTLTSNQGRRIDLSKMKAVELDAKERLLDIELDDGFKTSVSGGPPKDSIYFALGQDGEDIFMGDMPVSTLDLDKEFVRLYPNYKNQLFYDELKERDMIDMSMLGDPAEGIVPLTDRVVKMYHKVTQQRLRDCGYIGKRFPSNIVMDEVLDIKIGNNRRNPFREWVERQKWDGVPRLRRVMMDYFGATAPALRTLDDKQSEDEIRYLETVTEAWFLGAIARMYRPTQHDIVPVLIGVQGGGKGSGLRFLAGQDEWYAATTADVSCPEKFLESVRGAIIVEMGESKQIRGRNSQEDLKAFISQREDRIRKKYAKFEETFPRHFILAATANNDSIFADPTGARRFYPMYCRQANATKEIAVRHRGSTLQYEVEQIWAEALDLYKKGHKCYVGKEVDQLARVMQKEASIENPMSEMIDDWLNDPINGYTGVGSRIYRDLIMEQVFEVDPRCAPPNAERAWTEWVDSTRTWEKCKPFSHRNKTRRGFIRTKEVGEKLVVETLLLVDGDEPEYEDSKPEVPELKPLQIPELLPEENPPSPGDTVSKEVKEAIDVYTERVRALGLELDQPFPTYYLSERTIDILLNEGYIYNLGTEVKPVIMVGVVP